MEKVALSFNVKLAKIMTPIEKMSYIKINYSLSTIMSVFRRSTYSRLLVYDDSKINIIGALYVKDTLNHYEKIKSGKIKLESLFRIPIEVSSKIQHIKYI